MIKLKTLIINNFRNFSTGSFELDKSSIVLTGKNGSGKTSLLEAVFFLSHLRSFRTPRTSELKRIGENSFFLKLKLNTGKNWDQTLTASDDGNIRCLSVDDSPVSKASDFIGIFETVCFLPDDPLIVTGSPSFRRRFIDMLIASLDRSYFQLLQKYRQALENYNKLLFMKNTGRDLLEPYARILSESGSLIFNKRLQYFQLLQEKTADILNKMRPALADFSIISHHDADLLEPNSYYSRLMRSFEKDKLHGKTSTGPHYADYDFSASGILLKNYGSRGQCRIVSLALKLAELEFLNSDFSKRPVILVDDALADLDKKLRETFLDFIKDADQKIFAFPEFPSDSFFKDSFNIQL